MALPQPPFAPDTARPELARRRANFEPLSPASFARRAAFAYPHDLAVAHGRRRYSWAQTFARAQNLACAWRARGLREGDVCAALLANTPEFVEMFHAAPLAGIVMSPLNTRLDAPAIAWMLSHSGARCLLVDREFAPLAKAALAACRRKIFVVDIDDSEFAGEGAPIGEIGYEDFLRAGEAARAACGAPAGIDDEWRALSLNYTSGTTGAPKGVVYSHRGAYLMALGNTFAWQTPRHFRFLWTLPMFHCNGWCFPWTLAAQGGVSVCLRKPSAQSVAAALAAGDAAGEPITHLCGAPIVLEMLIEAARGRAKAAPPIHFMVAAAPPPAVVLRAARAAGILVTHVYGLTETYGPAVVCEWRREWDDLPPAAQAEKNARQGLPYAVQESLAVCDPRARAPLPPDGATAGEAMMRGNGVMMGYYRNARATAKAFAKGLFATGDVGVVDADNYLRLTDRAKDVIISGGENISSVEVENALRMHPAVAQAAVVGAPHPKWGETPRAIVELRPGRRATAEEIVAHCRALLAAYKCPREVVFAPIPRTVTGKIQKFKLRPPRQ